VKKFEQLHPLVQSRLALVVLKRTAVAGVAKSIEQIAQEAGQTPLQWWREACAEIGLDEECEPWPGFPKLSQPRHPPDPNTGLAAFAKLEALLEELEGKKAPAPNECDGQTKH
jgi:hypothetical protein